MAVCGGKVRRCRDVGAHGAPIGFGRRLRGVLLALAVAGPLVAVAAPAAGPAQAQASSDWLAIVNGYRQMSGLAPVAPNATWSAGGASHSCYMLRHGLTHAENANLAGYTPAGDQAGRSGNVAADSNVSATARNFIDLWMTGPFHAIGILRPQLTASGYGECRDSSRSPYKSAATLDVLRGINWGVPKPSTPVVFPGRNARLAANKFIAESPNPVQMCGWTGSAGLPLIAMMPATFTSAGATLVGPSGPVQTCVLHAGNVSDATAKSIMGGQNAVVVVPRAPLAEGIYTAAVTAGSQSTSWMFEIDLDAPVPATMKPPTTPLPSTRLVTDGADGFEAVSPFRLTDTRKKLNGTRLKARTPKTIRVAPSNSDVTAVSANFTVANPAGPGFLTVYDCSKTVPEVATVNHGMTPVGAQAIVPVRAGTICVYSLSDTDLVIDVNGFVRGAGNLHFQPVTPDRLLDSRTNASSWLLRPNTRKVVKVAGVRKVPAGAAAVALNLTSVSPDRDGFITIWPCDAPKRPVVANVNFTRGQNRANAVIVPLSASGTLCVESVATTHFVIDVNGYFTTKSAEKFTALSPIRLVDTRSPDPRWNAGLNGSPNGPLRQFRVPVRGIRGVPNDATAVALSLVAVQPSGPGFGTVWPCGVTRPVVSNVNYTPEQYATANGAVVKIGDDGSVCVTTNATSHVVVDITGVFR